LCSDEVAEYFFITNESGQQYSAGYRDEQKGKAIRDPQEEKDSTSTGKG
jgi:hypothetical protein